MSGRILLLTGERGVGKTTVCREVVARAKEAGYTCGGLLTLQADEPDGRVVVDVSTGDARPLTVPEGGMEMGRYRFDPSVLAWGAEAIARAVPCDLLVVDEVGPLEVERGQGWAIALDILRAAQFRLALVVVRPELIGAVQLRLPASAPAVLRVTEHNRDQLPNLLFSLLEREAPVPHSREASKAE
ncbi:MAG TPA: DUF2478 domain-containing protein [Thermoflexia bacterium]|nr:DUF2478 domain-containing protein [Thermoflexia bacterium]